MAIIGVIFILLWSVSPLSAKPLVLSFDQIGESLQDGTLIQIRGFLYQRPNGTLILASQPDLKSCCTREGSEVKQQLILKEKGNSLLMQQFAVTLEGIFKIDPQFNLDGQLVQLYVLEQVHLVSQNPFFSLWKIMQVVIILILLYFMIRQINPKIRLQI